MLLALSLPARWRLFHHRAGPKIGLQLDHMLVFLSTQPMSFITDSAMQTAVS